MNSDSEKLELLYEEMLLGKALDGNKLCNYVLTEEGVADWFKKILKPLLILVFAVKLTAFGDINQEIGKQLNEPSIVQQYEAQEKTMKYINSLKESLERHTEIGDRLNKVYHILADEWNYEIKDIQGRGAKGLRKILAPNSYKVKSIEMNQQAEKIINVLNKMIKTQQSSYKLYKKIANGAEQLNLPMLKDTSEAAMEVIEDDIKNNTNVIKKLEAQIEKSLIKKDKLLPDNLDRWGDNPMTGRDY